jgi:hypothetical protein
MKSAAGPGFSLEAVSRALAAGDIDNDGDVDLLVTNNGAPANLLVNEGGSRSNAIVIRLIGSRSNRSAIGARLVLQAGQLRLLREVQSGSSYLGQHDLRAHFGLGQADRVDRIEIHWPSGAKEGIEHLPANHIVTVKEGGGVVDRTPLAR